MKDGNLVLNDFSFQAPKKKNNIAKRHIENSPQTERKLQIIRKKEIIRSSENNIAGQDTITVLVDEDTQNKRFN